MKKLLAKFRCLKCGYEWEDIQGPTQCPKCNHLWVKWVNYKYMKKKLNWNY